MAVREPVTINAKYNAGHCQRCGGEIRKDQLITYAGRDNMTHADPNVCTSNTEPEGFTYPDHIPDQEIPF